MTKSKSTPPKADHGGSTEVTWDGGEGRQPYANQGSEEAAPAGGGDEFEAGDRGELSGRTQEQLDEVARKP
ncbi:MAG TPA: hypothetical protein VHA82_15045 [Ramlibacter sp.]|uniref:hypothetical protein n=1 Tax=Ramlibacter sp. TaxID=1917967 RepID=UPI002C525C26|nr:hypothetical protein [Ramlibacter sp.]HVZ45125.1 hypothetical protein [Ramlibacter sp.]